MWSPTPPIVHENTVNILNWSWGHFYLEKLRDDMIWSTEICLTSKQMGQALSDEEENFE